jgi:hypothetical protein
MLAGTALALAGCGTTQTSGVVAIGPDTYAVETRGRALATAVERGLTEATAFCTAQSRQTELLGTRINADSYQVAFRCTGGTGLAGNPGIIGRVPAGYATRNSALGPIPVSAPLAGGNRGTVITGQAFPPQAPPPPGFELGTVSTLPGRTATVTGNPFAPTPAPAARSLPPASSFAAPAFQAPAQPAFQAAAPPVAPSPFAPLTSPLAAAPAPAPFTPPAAAPVAAAPVSPAFAPLASPLASPAAAPAPSRAAAPAFQPLSSAPPSGPPPAFSALPPASSALQPVAAPTRGPASVPSAAALEGPVGTVPPAAFWNSPAR